MTARIEMRHRAVWLAAAVGFSGMTLVHAESEPAYALDAEVPDTAVVVDSDQPEPMPAVSEEAVSESVEVDTDDTGDAAEPEPEPEDATADEPAEAGTDGGGDAADPLATDDAAAVSDAEPTGAPNGVDRLREYVAAGDVFHARFVQSVYSESGSLQRESSGGVTLAPPSRFRWTYEKPFPQLIVSNGDEIFIYDEDLDQVTVYDSDAALRSSPTLIFRDPEALDRSFAAVPLDSEDGMQWVELTPRDAEADFDVIYVALDPIGIRVIELRDKLGQATQIRFDRVESTRSVDDAMFAFDIPEGADVIRP